MLGLDDILHEAMVREDHIAAMCDDFECIDSFANTDPESVDISDYNDPDDDDLEEDYDELNDEEEEENDYVWWFYLWIC